VEIVHVLINFQPSKHILKYIGYLSKLWLHWKLYCYANVSYHFCNTEIQRSYMLSLLQFLNMKWKWYVVCWMG